jgi:hypothetical protein
MKPWLLVVLGLALPAFAGCRTDPAIPLLERELYRKDKEINRLQWQIEDLQDLLNSGEERTVKRDRSSEDREPEAGGRRNHRGANGNGVKPPMTEPGTPTNKVPDILLPKDIPEVPKHLRNPSSNRSGEDGPALEEGPERFSSRPASISAAAGVAASAIPFNPSGNSRQVASVELDRMRTGGINSGDRSGDQGLLVVIEPRDAAGRAVDAPADVNVAVLDPALEGEAARVARWNFTAAETAGLFRRTNAGGAMHLAMAWPANPPKHNKLHLFVRYVTADGRKVETNQPIEIALPGDKTARWTAAESSRFADPPIEQDAVAGSGRRNEMPPARTPGPPPYMATRTSASNPERPVWSPDRR